MKKIGILTFTNTINYGALLQAFALQTILAENGFCAEILPYTNEDIKRKELNQGKNRRSLKGLLKSVVMGNALERKREAFDAFERKYITQGITLDSEREGADADTALDAINEYYDYFITGSDQVWNLNITHGDWHYFLDFVKEEKKILSYAPSFGNVPFPEDQYEKAAEYLKRFKAVSVREESGREKVKLICGRDAKVVIDPTLLLSKSYWETMTEFVPPVQHYILVYFPHNKKLTFDFVKDLKRKTGLPVVYLSISPKVQSGVKTIYDASPEAFLGWFKNADYIVTGSFHGVAFSLNLEKQFFYEPCGEGSRIGNLVHMCGVEDRSIEVADMNTKVDYKKVRALLSDFRQDSLNWLLNALRR